MITEKTSPRPVFGCFTTFLLLIIILLLGINVAVAALPYAFTYKTTTTSCDLAELFQDDGWRVVGAYSYELGSSIGGYTVYNECVLERPAYYNLFENLSK